MLVEVVDVGADLQAVVGRERGRVDPRPGHHHHAQARHQPPGLGVGGDHPPQQVAADPRPADRDDADPLVGPVAEALAELVAVAEAAGSNPVT